MRTEPANQNKAPTADYFFYAMGQKVLDTETGRAGTVQGRMQSEYEVDHFLFGPDDGADAEWLPDFILRAA